MSDQCLIGIINEEEEAVDKKYDDMGHHFYFIFFGKILKIRVAACQRVEQRKKEKENDWTRKI